MQNESVWTTQYVSQHKKLIILVVPRLHEKLFFVFFRLILKFRGPEFEFRLVRLVLILCCLLITIFLSPELDSESDLWQNL